MAKFEVKIFTTPTCPWCQKTKEFLKEKKVKYEEVNVGEDEEARDYMIEKTGQMGVPVIEISKEGEEDSKFIVGFDKGALSEALGLEG